MALPRYFDVSRVAELRTVPRDHCRGNDSSACWQSVADHESCVPFKGPPLSLEARLKQMVKGEIAARKKHYSHQ